VQAVSLFCRAALNTGELILPKTTAAVHWRWLTAILYEEQICIGVTTVTKCKL